MKNGAVLPSGLLGMNPGASSDGFKKTYQNNSIRMGIVIKTYGVNDPGNMTGLAPEYDVSVFEQHENKSSTVITYKNCLSSEGLGSIADYFEMTLRTQNKKSGINIDTKNQNGAVVLVLCLNGVSDKGIIIGALTHPDRETTLVDDGPRLTGEYNGVQIKVNPDGSTSLIFKGATDNDGNVIDSSQGNTTLSIEKDGSYQVDHKTITQRLDKSGVASLKADDDITNTTKKSFSVNADQDVNLTATKNMNFSAAQFAAKISGSASLDCASGSITATGSLDVKAAQVNVQAQGLIQMQAPVIVMDGLVNLGGSGGQPVLILQTTFLGIGNLGAPVISRAISGFANKVYAQ